MAAATNGSKPAVAPSPTLYCSNLPDKIQKDDLKRALYMLFSPYGVVLDIVAMKTAKMRGQAHVLFRDRDSSAIAMRALQDFDFFGKPMKIQYARTKSDTLAKLDGTYKQPPPPSSTEVTDVQKSIFAGPPGTTASNGIPQQASLPPPPSGVSKPAPAAAATKTDEVEEEEDDAAMDMSDED